MPPIELRRVGTKGTSLQNVDLVIERGAVVALSAVAAGDGRHLARILALDDDQWSGQFFLAGAPVHEMSVAQRRELRRTHLGVVFSQERLVPELTVLENLELPFTLRTRRAEREELIAPVMEMLELEELRHCFPRALSRRETQLVKIARAVVGSPVAVIADDLGGCLRSSDWVRVGVLMRQASGRGTAIAMTNSSELRSILSVAGAAAQRPLAEVELRAAS